MNDFERKVIEKLNDLCQRFDALKSETTISQVSYFENLPPDAVVGSDYVAYRFGCSESAVVRGRFETKKIPRLRKKPLAFLKRNVDAVFNEINQSIEEKAAKFRHKAK